ncbi:DEAD-box ATP-dependent RNA helicase 20-like [Chlorella sorokiniana]|uniref:RNA helicase n=1 Tax=Chlorella sorokiniana TaxID=3076 RepID=A0A2P6TYE9_CHLSO|nr:DEAD-box ATP-dependent RNA helicase 20-like [Chlorella sorokiniana]|eukprot:PRW59081.1 DEAD-box ATP-dependent RNA helicase 20-like [Chlorella sorokiniana]
MGVDYQARKAAKKNRRRSEELKPRRERKKKQARRLCRGPCYQEPGLRPEDLEDEAGRDGPAAGGEMARSLVSLGFGGGGGATAAAEAGGKAGGKRKAEGQKAAKPKAKQGVASEAAGDADAPSQAAKKPRLSTAVSLLDAKTAKTEAPRQKGLALEAMSGQLAQFPELLQRFMAGEGFAEPMPIQTKCWPLVLAGRDVEALAEPGSGKTLAYLLPAAVLLASKGHSADTRPDGPLALVLLPTRELAQQVAATCRDLRKYSGLRSVCITGGTDKGQQLEALSKQPHIVIATPGRLLDLVQEGSLQLGRVQYVVLDEADKMLGLGFQPQIEALRALLLPPAGGATAEEGGKKKRRVQVGLYTATMPESLAQEAAQWLHRPERVRISASAASISKSVAQVVQVCAEHKKAAKLQKHLERIRQAAQGMRNPPRVLIFANRIKTVRFLHMLVEEAGFRAALLHGERSQEEREAAVADFRSGKAQVLVATDVAARGLHIRNLPYVVNYDFPPNLEQYIHRVGRTGRLATDGHAFSFFTREMARLAPPVVELLEAHGQAVDPNLVKLADAFRIAAEKLGLVAGATGEAAAQPDRDDVLRSLGMKTQQQKKKERQAAKRQQQKGGAAAAAAADSEDEAASSSDEEEDQQQGRSQHGDQQAPAGQQQQAQHGGSAAAGQQQRRQLPPDELEPVAFIPSKTFTGARPGMVFKKGPRGLGYYIDAVQQRREQQQQQQQQAGGKRKGKSADAAKAAQKAEYQALKVKYSHAPIGGKGADHDKPAAGRKARQEQAAAAQQKAPAKAAASKPAAAAAPLLPGRLKELKRQRQLAAATGQLEGFSDSEDEAPAAAAPASKRHKALPGRLRKKLAKQKAAGGGD